ncbi:WD40 repeat domain-containing protein [Zavarzinella formosa]|uniref:WD40 repeat domain-containing protein n=1 Tax=Zavarzinella formosa TaxID=360055 RepID=UPI0002D8F2BA|nr:WD40 repeat domain-containing protein [Zavarzinella formosa]
MFSLVRPLLACLFIATPVLAQPIEQGPPPRLTDSYGDPLPDGAITRFGSLRLRHPGLRDFTILPDNKTAVSVGDDRMVRWWDLTDGRQTRSEKISQPHNSKLVISADGTTIAGVYDQTQIKKTGFFVCDAASGRIIYEVVDEIIGGLSISPNGSHVAANSHDARLILADCRNRSNQQFEMKATDINSIFRQRFSPDGKTLLVTDLNFGNKAWVFDVATGRQLFYREQKMIQAVVISGDHSMIAIAASVNKASFGESVIRVFNVATGKEVFATRSESASWRCHLAFHPNGKSLAILQGKNSSLIDLVTGKAICRLPDNLGGNFTPDGLHMADDDGHRIVIRDVKTGGERFGSLADFDRHASSVSPDGRRIAVKNGQEGKIGLWNTTNGQLQRQIDSSLTPNNRLEWSGDGKTLTEGDHQGMIRSWSVAAGGKLLHQTRVGRSQWLFSQEDYWLTPDGEGVMAADDPENIFGSSGWLSRWNSKTGELTNRFDWKAYLKFQGSLPDGSALMAEGKTKFVFVDAETGRPGTVLPKHHLWSSSSDSRLHGGWTTTEEGGQFHVWEVATGQELRLIDTSAYARAAGAITPDNRFAVLDEGVKLLVVDLADGRVFNEWKVSDMGRDDEGGRPFRHIQVMPGGRSVFTTLRNGTALMWDLTKVPRVRLSETHTEADLAKWWSWLADPDAKRAYAAIWRMNETPPEMLIPFLRQRLRPVATIAAGEAEKWIADLDHRDYRRRETAAKMLENVGPLILPELRKARLKPASEEARERIENLIAKFDAVVPPPETLRFLRVLAVLENIKTIESRRLVAELSQGVETARETKAARLTLGRMADPESWREARQRD